MIRNKMWIAALAVSALSTPTVFAAGEKMGGESSTGSTTSQVEPVSGSGSASFSQADKDRNGAVDSSEAASITGLDFTTADTDQNGRLSRSEFEAAVKKSGSSGSGAAGSSGSSAKPDRQPDGGPGK